MPSPEDLAPITAWLEAIHQAIKDHTEAVAEYQQSEQSQKQKQAQAGINTVVHLPVEVSEYYHAEQVERPSKSRNEKIRIRLEIVGVITAIILAILTFKTLRVFNKQLSEMQKQTTALNNQGVQSAKDAYQQLVVAQKQATAAQSSVQAIQGQVDAIKGQFRLDQKPYVWISSPTPSVPTTIDFEVVQATPKSPKQITISVHYTNFGKSPAIKVNESRVLEITGDATVEVKPPTTGEGSFLPPGKDDFLTFVSRPLKDEEVTQEVNGPTPPLLKDGAISFHIRFQYFDSLGNKYQTDSCMSRLQTGAFRYCDKGNDIKDCSKEKCA